MAGRNPSRLDATGSKVRPCPSVFIPRQYKPPYTVEGEELKHEGQEGRPILGREGAAASLEGPRGRAAIPRPRLSLQDAQGSSHGPPSPLQTHSHPAKEARGRDGDWAKEALGTSQPSGHQKQSSPGPPPTLSPTRHHTPTMSGINSGPASKGILT